MKRLSLLPAIGLIAAICAVFYFSRRANDQQVSRVGIATFVDHPVLNTIIEHFELEMKVLGYDEHSIRYFRQNAQGVTTDIDPLLRTLLRQRLDVLVPVSTPVSRVAFALAPTSQKIVYSFVTNPDDLEPELSRHKGTGVSDRINYRRSLQLVRDLLPECRRVGVLYNPAERNSEVALTELRNVAQEFQFVLNTEAIGSASEIRDSARRLARTVDVIFIGPDNTIVGSAPIVIQAAESAKLPVIAVDSGTVEAGALAAYSVDYSAIGRETARLVDRVLKEPRTLHERMIPIYNEDLVVNFCAANKLNYTFPESVLSRAGRVIRCTD